MRTSSAHIAWKRCFPSVKSTTKLGCKLYPKTERKLDLEEIFAFDQQSCLHSHMPKMCILQTVMLNPEETYMYNVRTYTDA